MESVNTVTENIPYKLYTYQSSVERKEISFSEKSAIFEKLTGLQVDENTLYVMSKESQVRLGYMGEFFRVSNNSTGGHTALVEDTAKKYTELRDKILEQYKDDKDAMYKKIGELNQAFETALKNTCLMPAYSQKVNTEIRISYNEADRIRNERELENITQEYAQYNQSMKVILSNLQSNMIQHMDTFYEGFINKIQTQDFDAAFTDSMALLQNSETKSYDNISYNDLLKIRDTVFPEATEFDENGKPMQYRYNTLEDAFRAVIYDKNISYVVRKDIADHLGFYIKAEDV